MASTQKCQWHRIQHAKNIDFSLEVLWTVLKECLLQSITRPIWWLMMMEITLLDRLCWKRVVKRATCINQTTNNDFFLIFWKTFSSMMANFSMLKVINVRTVPGTPDHKMLNVETLRALCDICRKFNRLSCGCRLFLEQAGHSCYCVVSSPNGVRKPVS